MEIHGTGVIKITNKNNSIINITNDKDNFVKL
jgi:hypothetical protein